MEREKRTKGKSPESVEQSHGEGNGSRGHRVSMEVIFFPPSPSHLPGTAGHGGEGVTPSNTPEPGKLEHTPASCQWIIP